MKKIVRKFWGVAITVMLLSSLFIVGAPAAAVPLTWNMDVFVPSFVAGTVWTQFPGTDIVDFSVSQDGMTVYAALQAAADPTILLKSTNGGGGWTDLTAVGNNRVPVTLDSIDFVASSPDNPSVVVVLDAGGVDGVIAAAASQDGGLNFYDMGTIAGTGALDIAAVVYDLDVGPATSNNIYYVAVAGASTVGEGDDPGLYYYNFGASVGNWRNAVTDFGTAAVTPPGLAPPWAGGEIDNFRAIKFAPDGSVVALSEEIGTALIVGALRLHVASLTAHRWDTDLALTGYPVIVDSTDPGVTPPVAPAVFNVRAASIGVGPDYSGSEQETQVAFVGASILTTAGAETGGIYRIDDSGTLREIRANTGINSIDYDGVTVVAGSYMDNNVFRITDPMAGSPSAASARSMKRIGIDDNGGVLPDVVADMVIVRFAGETVFGSKRADASALSKSTDLGNTWNDFTLMDSAKTVIDDIYISPDGSVKYVSANDWAAGEGEVSIYRVAGMSSQRVLCVDQRPSAGNLNLKLRGIPGDPNVVYAFDQNDISAIPITDIYQTTDGGINRWSRRTTYPGNGAINDLAVESSAIVYAATGQLVYKSTNSGSSWGAGVDTLIGIYSMISLGEGRLVVGGLATYVGWSTDGGATWTKNGAPVPGGGPFLVAATGLTATDYVFAAAANGAIVSRANPVPFTEFKNMNLPAFTDSAAPAVAPLPGIQGMVLTNGILYVLGSEDILTAQMSLFHSLAPTVPGSHPPGLWGTENIYASYVTVQNGPIAPATATTMPVLRAATTASSIQIYAPVAFFGAPAVFYFDDIVSPPTAAPTLMGPADGSVFKIVSTMLADAQLVNFTWNRAAPQITSYLIWVALDENFTELLFAVAVPSNVSPVDIVSFVGARGVFDPGLTYYWRVQALTPFTGGFSETRSFTIEPSAASVPGILSPINGATVNTVSPAFSWGAVTDATMYEFQLSELPGFETTIFTDETSGPGEALPVTIELERGKTYFWRVRAIEPTMGDWSPTANFMIAELTTTPTQPTPTQTTITIPPPPPGTTTIITVPPPEEPDQIAPAYIWAIIVIGAILVIAVIVLIVRTRRSV